MTPQAYEAYLKGRFFWNKRNKEAIEKSIDYYTEAIRLDPRYAPAYAGLAGVHRHELRRARRSVHSRGGAEGRISRSEGGRTR